MRRLRVLVARVRKTFRVGSADGTNSFLTLIRLLQLRVEQCIRTTSKRIPTTVQHCIQRRRLAALPVLSRAVSQMQRFYSHNLIRLTDHPKYTSAAQILAMAGDTTAASRALGVNELLEMVLSHLDVATLLDARRVCTTWHAMTASSVLLQQRLFLRVAPTYDGRDLFEC